MHGMTEWKNNVRGCNLAAVTSKFPVSQRYWPPTVAKNPSCAFNCLLSVTGHLQWQVTFRSFSGETM